MPKRIDIEDAPEYERLFPVQAFFNAIDDDLFVRTVDCLTRGTGAGFNNAVCSFPGDLDEYAIAVELKGKVPDGIMFSLFEDEVVVDIPTFRRFLTLACEAYVHDHPEDRARIEELLARPQPALTPPGTNVVPA